MEENLLAFDKAALDIVAYMDFIESRMLDFGRVPFDPVALYSEPGAGALEVSLKDIARRSRPALSLSKSALMMSPVDLFSCFEAFRSRLASAY